jgi:hypothetical protein
MDELSVSWSFDPPSADGFVRYLYGILTSVDGRLLWITIRYGERMRAWVDVGYSVDVES